MSFHPASPPPALPKWHYAYVICDAINKPNKTLAKLKDCQVFFFLPLACLQLFGNANYQENFAQTRRNRGACVGHKNNITFEPQNIPLPAHLFYSPNALSYFSSLYFICSRIRERERERGRARREPATEGIWQSAQMLRLFAHIICYMYISTCVCVCVWAKCQMAVLAGHHTYDPLCRLSLSLICSSSVHFWGLSSQFISAYQKLGLLILSGAVAQAN